MSQEEHEKTRALFYTLTNIGEQHLITPILALSQFRKDTQDYPKHQTNEAINSYKLALALKGLYLKYESFHHAHVFANTWARYISQYSGYISNEPLPSLYIEAACSIIDDKQAYLGLYLKYSNCKSWLCSDGYVLDLELLKELWDEYKGRK